MLRKVGKSSDFLFEYQPHLLGGIDSHCAQAEIFEKSYRASPIRSKCVVCETQLGPADFSRNSIDYILCSVCGHINGNHELSDKLADSTYDSQTTESMKYDELYIMPKEKYLKTVSKIYLPKAEFVKESLAFLPDVLNLQILDFGTGSGHMVQALRDAGFRSVKGIDPMQSTVNFGNIVMGVNGLSKVAIRDSIKFLEQTSSELISMICTLPHVTNQNKVLLAMSKNPNIRYTFQKLPMFSLGAMLDITSPNTNSRVLAGTHNHLYTEKSLEFMEKLYGLNRISEWRFGSDILDLYRNIFIKLTRAESSMEFKSCFSSSFLSMIDELQLVVDTSKFASEIHVLWEFSDK
jgi:hypothetical protein